MILVALARDLPRPHPPAMHASILGCRVWGHRTDRVEGLAETRPGRKSPQRTDAQNGDESCRMTTHSFFLAPTIKIEERMTQGAFRGAAE